LLSLYDLNKKINDIVVVNDMDLIRSLINSCIDEINVLTGGYKGLFSLVTVENTNKIKIPDSVILFINLYYMNNQLSRYDYSTFFASNKPANPSFYTMINNVDILLNCNITSTNKTYFQIEAYTNFRKLDTDSIDIEYFPDNYNIIIFYGCLSKLFLHHKFINADLANVYQAQYNTLLQGLVHNKNFLKADK